MKIVGIGICGKDESKRYMRKTLEEFKRLCDHTVIATNFATDEDKAMIDEFGFEHYEDNRTWGIEQPNIKTDLLTYVGKYNPDWIVALDMDEVFPPEFTRQEADRLASTYGEIAWYFLIVNLYNDTEHFAHDKGIQRFWNIRFYKYLPQYGLQFQRKALHCGLGPPIAYKYGWYAPYYVEHYGLMNKEDREKKAQRYKQFDPNKKYKGGEYYADLERDVRVFKFDRQKLLQQLKEAKDCQPRKKPLSLDKMINE